MDGTCQIFKQTNRSSLQLTHHTSLNLVHNDAFDININWHKQFLNTVNFNIPTPLRKTPKIHHVSSIKNASFNPILVTPHSTVQSHLRLVCRQLTYSSFNNSDTSEDTPTAPRATPDAQVYLEEDEEEDFQMLPLDDQHWTTKEVPDRTLCIHKYALLHRLCPYPCPYVNYLLPSYAGTMDLSDISNFEDIMITSSNEDIPALGDAPY